MQTAATNGIKFACLLLCLILTGSVCSANAPTDGRYYYSGNGTIHLVNAKTGMSFNGEYRSADGAYSEEALDHICQTFGGDPGEPLSRISLRLIEYFDFLEDRLRPGAKITIVSGWRSPEYNTNLRNKGGLAAKASLHQYGMAADLKMEGVSSEYLWNYVKQLGFGGAGYYHGDLVHIDVGPARWWDETTSGVGTDISDNNKLIGLIADFDRYRPGETLLLRFIRMTAFPIGVAPELALEKIEGTGMAKTVVALNPTYTMDVGGRCPQFTNIEEMMGIGCKLPAELPPGRYQIRATFCGNLWENMPAEVVSHELEIMQIGASMR
jgi:uncharacterized protein YcbK (DUF882 family)